MNSEWWKRVDKVGLGVLAGALAVLVPFCGSYGLWDPWETHYGEAARQIIVRGDWWTLYWEDDYFFSKPILLFWMMAASFKLLGVTELAARLPVVLSAVAGIWAVYWGVRAVTGSRRTGALAAACVTSIPLYAFIARQCITDMPFVASLTIAMMALARYEFSPPPPGGRPRHLYLFYAACGLATLAKGPLGLLLPGAVVLSYLVLSGNWSFLKRARIPTGALVFLGVTAPWYVTMVAMHGRRFINEFIVYNNVQRATGVGVHGAHLDWLYYVRAAVEGNPETGGPVLQAGTFPWLALFPAAAITYLVAHFGRVARRGTGQRGEAAADEGRGPLHLALLLLCWAVVSFVVFSSIPTKFHHYLLPLAPPVAMLAALWLADAAAGRIQRLVAGAGLVVAAGIVVWVARLLADDPSQVLNLFIYEYGRADLRRFEVGDVYLYAGSAIALALVAAAFLQRWLFQLGSVAAGVAVGLTMFGLDSYMMDASDCVSQADAFRRYEAERRPGDRLINWHMNHRGEVFYGRSEAVKAVSDTHLRWLLSRADRSFIVARRGLFSSLSSALRRLTGQEPNILNPETCNTRMVLYDGPPVRPPRFEPPPGALVDRVPESAVRPEGVRIGPDVELAGYELEWLGAGEDLVADVTLYLRCLRDTDEWWKVFIHGESAALPGRRAISDHTAVGDAYPSVAWRPGDVVVDRTRIRVGWILEALGGEGEITVNVGLFHDETRAWVTPEGAGDGENRVVVGRYSSRDVPDGAVVDALPAGVEALATPVRLGEAATLLASTVEVRGEGARARAEVVLYLRAGERTRRPWQIFLHAEGEGGRRQVSDHHPAGGRLRTTDWEPGRIVVDRTVLDLGELEPGGVRFSAGMFQGNQRAAVAPAGAADGQNRVLLGERVLQ